MKKQKYLSDIVTHKSETGETDLTVSCDLK